MQNKAFLQLAWSTLFVIFLVILAGSIVRATGSGMGCPDWPKCFGYFIPPTEESQVIFQPNTEYEKGQMILQGDELWKAKQDFQSSDALNKNNWEVHEKHDYAIFNATHTWIEYINRLFGALSGLFMLALFFYSLYLYFTKRLSFWVVAFCFIGVILLGFQAWLGRTVVDSNLEAAKITAHLFGALALIAVILLIIRLVMGNRFLHISKQLKMFAWLAFIVFVVQMVLGTEVRQLVDELMPSGKLGETFTSNQFKIHRSFSWLVLATTGALLFLAYRNGSRQAVFHILLFSILSEFLVGISMYYFEFPILSQPIHLLLSCVLFSSFFWIILGKTAR